MDYREKYQAAMEEHVLKTAKKLYVDTSLLKDYTLGATLYLLYRKSQGEDKYKYLYTGLTEWDIRLVDDIDIYYPDLGITQEEVNETISSKALHDIIFRIAPSTTVADILKQNLLDINQKTAMLKDYKFPIVTLNTYPLSVSESLQEELIAYWNRVYMVDTRVICEKIINIDANFLLDHDTFYMQDFMDFITKKEYSDKFTNGRLGDKHIYAPKRVEDYHKTMNSHTDRKDIELDFVFSEYYTKLACNFSFLENHKVHIEKE